jgi:hypothetical protein
MTIRIRKNETVDARTYTTDRSVPRVLDTRVIPGTLLLVR